jgi:hypothetical protein
VREVIVVPFPSPLPSRASDSSVRAPLIEQRSAGASATNLFRVCPFLLLLLLFSIRNSRGVLLPAVRGLLIAARGHVY